MQNEGKSCRGRMDGGLDVVVLHTLNMISMKVIINTYCSKGENFTAKQFKDNLKELVIPPLHVHKKYADLEAWRSIV